MIVEQNKLFDIIPIGLKKEVPAGTFTPLSFNSKTGQPETSFHVLNAGLVSFNTRVKGHRVTLESKDPKQINQFRIKTRSPGIVRRVYKWVPDRSG